MIGKTFVQVTRIISHYSNNMGNATNKKDDTEWQKIVKHLTNIIARKLSKSLVINWQTIDKLLGND